MMKVALIDDEPLQLIGMRSIIPWEDDGFAIVGEARNGEEGLALILRENPDIVVADIVMPRMDGLEMIRRVREARPGIKVILLSCMSDVAYYEEAIKLGVSEYLQKERITPEQLLETVNRVAGELRRERVLDENDGMSATINESVVRSEFLNLVLRGGIADQRMIDRKLADWRLIAPGRACALAAISAHRLSDEDRDNAFLDYGVINLCQEIVRGGEGGFFFRAPDGRIAALLPALAAEREDRLFERMRETVEQCLDCVLTMGLSRPFRGAEGLRAAYSEALEAEERGYFFGLGALYRAGEAAGEDAAVAAKAEGLLAELDRDDTPFTAREVSRRLSALLQLLEMGAASKKRAQALYASFIYHIVLRMHRMGVSPDEIENGVQDVIDRCWAADTVSDAALVVREFVLAAERRLSEAADGGESVVDGVKSYVEANLRGKIALGDVARSVYLSPSYVCRLFKKETGENLSDYIARKKLEEAERMLRDMSVGEVSDALGYRSHSHFIRIFREQTGTTPLKYQKEQATKGCK